MNPRIIEFTGNQAIMFLKSFDNIRKAIDKKGVLEEPGMKP